MLGSIAQLVQSVCLTSRGSGVRLPLLPRKERSELSGRSFRYDEGRNPRPSAWRHQPRIGERSFRRKRRAEMPETGRRTVSACPWGLSRSDWGIDGRALACQGLGFDSLCSHGKRLEKSSLFLLYTVELPAPDWYFSVVAREIHLGRSMPFQCTVSYAACLDEAISATSSQGNANTDSCGGASLPG